MQLDANLIKDAIDAYIKAADASNYVAIIAASERDSELASRVV